MKSLCYRGIPYSQSYQQIQTIFSKNTGCYRGQPSNIPMLVKNCQSRSPKSPNSAVICKFRGVPYVVVYYEPPEKPDKALVHRR